MTVGINRARATIYVDRDLLTDIKEIAEMDSRSVANYLERVLLGSEQLDEDLRTLRYRREHPPDLS